MTEAGGAAELPVAIIGYGFMGRAHAMAWHRTVEATQLKVRPRIAVICGRNGDAAAAAAEQLGIPEISTDWKVVIARPDVQVVDICTPGSSHAEIAIAALQAGKHVLCEKPLANTLAEAERMAAAANDASARGVRSMVGFNYRRVPALIAARRLVEQGRIGQLRHVRATYLQDWLINPAFPLTWRLAAAEAGSGALGDLGAHIIDLAQFLSGDQIVSVLGRTKTFVAERPVPQHASGLSGSAAEGGPTGQVDVDDAVTFLAEFSKGAIATFEATRMATGHKNGLRIELNGELGSIRFDLERLNELEFHETAAQPAGFARVLVTEPTDPYMDLWWPPGHVIGWEHTFVHEVIDLCNAIASGTDPEPSFADGLSVQAVLDCVAESARSGRWEPALAPTS